jgi:hypothetical protein
MTDRALRELRQSQRHSLRFRTTYIDVVLRIAHSGEWEVNERGVRAID